MNPFKIFIRDSKKNIILLYAMTIVVVFLSYSVSENTKDFFNFVFESKDFSTQSGRLSNIIISYIIIFGLSIWTSVLNHRFIYKGMLNLRESMLNSILYTSFNYFQKNPVGKIWGEIVSTTNKLCPFYKSILFAPIDISQVIIYGLIIFNASVFGGIIICSFIPLIIVVTFYTGKILRKKEEESLAYFREMSSWSVDTLSSAKLIKTISSHSYFTSQFYRRHKDFNDTVVKMSVVKSYVDAVQNIVVMLAPLIIVYFSSQIMQSNAFSIGDIVILYTFSPLFFNAFRSFYSKLFDFFGVKPSVDAVTRILSLKKEAFGTLQLMNDIHVSVENFNYSIGNKEVTLPNFNISQGDKILITGESGMGKSTFFNCLTGLYHDFHEEAVKINGKNIKAYDLYELRKKIILVSQENMIFNASLKENLLMNSAGVISEESLQRTLNLLRLEELSTREQINKDKLSGGEKARINLAQALLRKPKLLLIDETLSSVDEEFEFNSIKNIIDNNPNLSIVYITHRSSIRDLFDRVVKIG